MILIDLNYNRKYNVDCRRSLNCIDHNFIDKFIDFSRYSVFFILCIIVWKTGLLSNNSHIKLWWQKLREDFSDKIMSKFLGSANFFCFLTKKSFLGFCHHNSETPCITFYAIFNEVWIAKVLWKLDEKKVQKTLFEQQAF